MVSAPTIAAVRASLALRLLTDFTLVYSAAAGQILRHAVCSARPERDEAGGADLLRHVLYSQLAEVSEPGGNSGRDEKKDEGAFVGLDGGWDGGERASYFLRAVRALARGAPPRARGGCWRRAPREGTKLTETERSPRPAPARAVAFVTSP